ncbi:MAG: aspartyl protease family protein, partial [Deltaproteobacteria bacterium]|nr:aspartyl protease family protein [Deltaproteobacteria bacterium]
MICPKCGFSQPDDYYCAQCGVNVEKYVQKKRKKRFNLGLIITVLSIATLSLVLFMSIQKDPKKSDISEDKSTETKVAQKSPSREKPQEQNVTPRARRRPGKVRGETPGVARSGNQLARKQETAGKSSLEDAAKRSTPQSEPKESTLTSKGWFDKGFRLDDDSDSEIAFYQKAIELDPKFAPAYYRLGAIYFRQAEYDLAAENFATFLLHASETDRQRYNIELYFSPEDLEAIREATEEPGPEEVEQEVAAEPAEVERAERAEEVSTETSEEVESIVRFSTSNGHMVVPVLLNESRTSSLLFDTGASITVLSTKLAQSLGLVAAVGKTIRLKTVAADVKAKVATLDSITVGGLSRSDFPVAVVDLNLGSSGRFEGILGMDFLGNYTIRIDNQANRIFLSPR